MERLPLSRRAAARLLSVMALATFVVAACSGGSPLGGGGGDPSAVVRDALAIVQSKDLTKIEDLACAAQKEEVAKSFDFSASLGDVAPGIDSQQILDAMTIDTSKVTVGQATVTGDTATVPMTGSMSMSIDTEKIRPIMKAALEAQGLPADDAMIDQAMTLVGSFSGQDIPMNETLELVKENGAWKICE